MDNDASFQKIIISSQNNFVPFVKYLMSINKQMHLSDFIDGRIFTIKGFNFQKLLSEGIGYGIIPHLKLFDDFEDNNGYIHPRVYFGDNKVIILGSKSYIANSVIEGAGIIRVGSFTSISWDIRFGLALINDHIYQNVSSYSLYHLDWVVDKNDFPINNDLANINIGSDVWVGRGCKFKTPIGRPLNIGDGAVIASDSVVVKDVPPYAIVGGNPAKIIKYRFDQETIKAMQRIAWWNWDLLKIHDNFHLFNNIPEFVRKFDPQY